MDLPETGWSGGDTYGAGALSPDGRWWAGAILSGFFVLDLRDGSVRVGAPQAGHHYGDAGMPTFSWSPDSDEPVVTTRSRADRVSLATVRRQPFPRPRVTPYLLGDGGRVQCQRGARGVATCTTYSEAGTVTAERDVPADLQGRWTSLIDRQDGTFGFSMPTSSHRNERRDWDIVLADRDFRATAVLTLPRGSEINGLGDVLSPTALGLIAYDDRQLLAFLPGSGEIVRLLRTGELNDEYDYWDVSFARDLVDVGGPGTAQNP